MNLEIASRLVSLRKEKNLSQEALAEKLGISRQAVSKWERAEASPDTDNLIALARLYQVSLDELLMIYVDEESDAAPAVQWREEQLGENGDVVTEGIMNLTEYDREGEQTKTDENSRTEQAENVEEDVHVGFDGIHVKDKGAEVHVSWRGIHVYDKKDDNEVHIDKHGIRVNGEDASKHIFLRGHNGGLPLGIIAIVAYIVIGVCFNLWHPGWLILFLVPIISTLIDAVYLRNPSYFAYPVLAVLIFLFVGFVYGVWHPTWVVFLTIPIYYSIAEYILRRRKADAYEEEDMEQM